VLVNLDPKTEAGPLEGMKVIVGAAHVVVSFGRPPRSVLEAEARRQQRGLCLLRVAGDEVQIAEPSRGVGIASHQLRAFHEHEWPVIRLPGPLEQRGSDKGCGPAGALLPEELLGHFVAGEAQPPGR
jgi:hypothetical protein